MLTFPNEESTMIVANEIHGAAPTTLDAVRTLPELLAYRVAKTPSAEAYRHYDVATKSWVSTRFDAFGVRVARFADALATLAMPRGARVGVLLPNGLDAVSVDQGALALGLVPVPMHALDNPASIAFILADCEASALFATTRAQWDAIAGVGTALPALRTVVVLEGEAGASSAAPTVTTLAAWLEAAKAVERSASSANRPGPEDLAAVVYTSGTTGKPKGVMLTHDNVVSNVRSTFARVAPETTDVFLSFLPLSHTFERTAGYYLPIAAGSAVAFARSIALLGEDMKMVRPTILVSVPRIYERVLAKVQATLAGDAVKKRVFELAQAVGWRRFRRAQRLPVEGSVPAFVDALAWPLLERLAAAPLRAQFGGRLRVAVSGGAALPPAIARCFLGLGLPIVQGYGMTETSPVVSANAPDDNDPATVGRPLPGVEVRIGDNRELLVRGPNVMRGYWNREADTERSFVDGWLRTGDQAALEDGRIRILGRVKEIIVTSTGEKIAPVDLELAIAADPLFDQVYVFGDDRPFIACIAVLGRESWARLAASLGVSPDDPASLDTRAVRDEAMRRITELTRAFPRYAQPRAVRLTLAPFTVENTFLTPTLKLKRLNLAAHYAALIEGIYRP